MAASGKNIKLDACHVAETMEHVFFLSAVAKMLIIHRACQRSSHERRYTARHIRSSRCGSEKCRTRCCPQATRRVAMSRSAYHRLSSTKSLRYAGVWEDIFSHFSCTIRHMSSLGQRVVVSSACLTVSVIIIKIAYGAPLMTMFTTIPLQKQVHVPVYITICSFEFEKHFSDNPFD